MKSSNDINEKPEWGDEAPRLKEVIIVFAVAAILFFFSWLTYYKLGWFH